MRRTSTPVTSPADAIPGPLTTFGPLSFAPTSRLGPCIGDHDFQPPSRQASWNTVRSAPCHYGVTLGTEPNPSEDAVISTGGEHPFQPSIVDFHFPDIAHGKPVVITVRQLRKLGMMLGQWLS